MLQLSANSSPHAVSSLRFVLSAATFRNILLHHVRRDKSACKLRISVRPAYERYGRLFEGSETSYKTDLTQ